MGFKLEQVDENKTDSVVLATSPLEEGIVTSMRVTNSTDEVRTYKLKVGDIVVNGEIGPLMTTTPSHKLNIPAGSALTADTDIGVVIVLNIYTQVIDMTTALTTAEGLMGDMQNLLDASEASATRSENAIPMGDMDDSQISPTKTWSSEQINNVVTDSKTPSTDLEKAFVIDEEIDIVLPKGVLVPSVSVSREVPQTGFVDSSSWYDNLPDKYEYPPEGLEVDDSSVGLEVVDYGDTATNTLVSYRGTSQNGDAFAAVLSKTRSVVVYQDGTTIVRFTIIDNNVMGPEYVISNLGYLAQLMVSRSGAVYVVGYSASTVATFAIITNETSGNITATSTGGYYTEGHNRDYSTPHSSSQVMTLASNLESVTILSDDGSPSTNIDIVNYSNVGGMRCVLSLDTHFCIFAIETTSNLLYYSKYDLDGVVVDQYVNIPLPITPAPHSLAACVLDNGIIVIGFRRHVYTLDPVTMTVIDHATIAGGYAVNVIPAKNNTFFTGSYSPMYRFDSSLNIISTTPIVSTQVGNFLSADFSYGTLLVTYPTAYNVTRTEIKKFTYPPIYSVDDYSPIITSLSGQVRTLYWSDIRHMAISETLHGQEINYAVSTDDKMSFHIAKTLEGFRTIVKFDTVWKVNTASDYGYESWTNATVDDIYQALKEAMAIPANKMPKTQVTDLADTEYFIPADTLDFTAILATSDEGKTPIFNGVSITYDMMSQYHPAILNTHYKTYTILDDVVKFKSLHNNTMRIRII